MDSSKIIKLPPIYIFLLTSIMAPLVLELIAPLLPYMSKEFNVSLGNTGYIITLALAGIVVGQITTGILSYKCQSIDLINVGLVILCFSSIICALTDSFVLLLFGRFFQGMSASLIGVNSRAIVRQIYPLDRYIYAINYITLTWRLFVILGPIIGVIIYSLFGWRVIFIFMTIYGAITMYIINNLLKNAPVHVSKFSMKRNFFLFMIFFKKKSFLLKISALGTTTASGIIFVQFAPTYIYYELQYQSPIYLAIAIFFVGIGYILANFLILLFIKLKCLNKLAYISALSLIIGCSLMILRPEQYIFFIISAFFINFSIGINAPLLLLKSLIKYKRLAILAASAQGFLLWLVCSVFSLIFQLINIQSTYIYLIFVVLLSVYSFYIGVYSYTKKTASYNSS